MRASHADVTTKEELSTPPCDIMTVFEGLPAPDRQNRFLYVLGEYSNHQLTPGGSPMIHSPVIDLIQATVQLEQPTASGGRLVGTGFLIKAADATGAPRTVLITADHVFEGMKGREAEIGYRTVRSDGTWTYTPQPLAIRDKTGAPLWTRDPGHDVAAIRVTAPESFARAAIPEGYLATARDVEAQNLEPGSELFVLGFPMGVSANAAGFPILRSGRVASYPVSPETSPTFLLDFSVFPGNSGGPVFITPALERASAKRSHPLIAGMLTQQVEMGRQALEIGVVTHARYVTEAIDLLLGPGRPHAVERPAPPRLVKASTVRAVPAAVEIAPPKPRGPLGALMRLIAGAWTGIERAWSGLAGWAAGGVRPG